MSVLENTFDLHQLTINNMSAVNNSYSFVQLMRSNCFYHSPTNPNDENCRLYVENSF